jgi:hypothetical protein
MTELYTITGEEFYLELIAKQLSGEISEKEQSSLQQWMKKMKEHNQTMVSPLLGLYQGIVGK